MAQMVKSMPAMQETWVPSLGQKEPLEKEMATHSSILAWRIPWTEGHRKEQEGTHQTSSPCVSPGDPKPSKVGCRFCGA